MAVGRSADKDQGCDQSWLLKLRDSIAAVLIVGISSGDAVGATADDAGDGHARAAEYRASRSSRAIPLDVTVPAPLGHGCALFLISIDGPRPDRAGSVDRGSGRADRSARRRRLEPEQEPDCGDPDVLWSIRQPGTLRLRITITPPPQWMPTAPRSNRSASRSGLPSSAKTAVEQRGAQRPVAFEAEPNDKPESANHLTLGETVYGLADDRPYLPLGDGDDRQRADRRSRLVHVYL